MKEILGAPSLIMLATVLAPTGTAPFTAVKGSIDTRNMFTGAGAARHLSIALAIGTSTTNKSLTYIINHAASATDAATNGTTLATVTRTQGLLTAQCDRIELDMLGLQPGIGIQISQSGTGGTAENIAFSAIATGFRTEQTPISSSSLANGVVTIIAAGGVTQAN